MVTGKKDFANKSERSGVKEKKFTCNLMSLMAIDGMAVLCYVETDNNANDSIPYLIFG